MLFYLDNQQSIGPDSRAGQKGKRGLNENLAREILELHTLGVGGGYSQADVTTFARILTGWMIAGRDGRLGEPGSFVFNASAHEPGDEVLLGKTYSGGMGQAEAVLADIARHPSTAQHIATKLARHFIADDPPPQAVARLAKVFLDKDGDLKALAYTLVDMPEAWTSPLQKIRSPYEYVAAIRRATYRGPSGGDPGQILGWLNALGEPLWQPPGPNGFPDGAATQASPEGMKVRLDIAWQAARQVKDIDNPSDLLDAIIGPSASAETRQAIARAESKQQGLALLFMSPEFQRR